MKKVWAGLLIFIVMLAAYGCSKSNEVYSEMIEQGLLQIEKEEYESAKNFFEKALEAKPKDERATKLTKQTQNMLKAKVAFDEGDFEAAKSSAEDVFKVEEGSDMLKEKAKSLLDQMKEMEQERKDVATNYEKAEQHFQKGEIDDSLSILEELVKKDLSHPFFSKLKSDIDTFITVVKDAKEKAVAEAKAKAAAEAKAKAEAEAKAKAAAEKAEKEKKAAEEKANRDAASKDIGAAGGYWLTEDHTEACHLTSTFLACAVKESDVMFKYDITNINHISNSEIELTFSNGYKTRIALAGNNVLQGESGRMTRVTKEEANSIYGGYYELPDS